MNDENLSALTPWEFAYHLQERLFERFGESPEFSTDVCDVLAINLLGALPTGQREVLDRFPVIVLPTRRVNAMCIGAPGGGAGSLRTHP